MKKEVTMTMTGKSRSKGAFIGTLLVIGVLGAGLVSASNGGADTSKLPSLVDNITHMKTPLREGAE